MSKNLTSMLRRSAVGVGLVSATILVGCSSDPNAVPTGSSSVPSTPPPSMAEKPANAAKTDFVNNVYPKLKAEMCTSCHVTGVAGAPKYLGDTAEASYTAIAKVTPVYQSSAESSLLTKGAHQGSPAFSDAGVAAAKKWLDAEFPPGAAVPGEEAPDPGGSVVGFNAAIQQFIRCMAQDDWEQHMKFYPFIQTQSVGNCAGCHEAGNAGTFLNADFNVTFKAMKTVPYVYRLVQAVYEGDSIVDLAPSNRLIDKGQITTDCFDPNNVICHDTYNVPKIQAQGLKNFQTLTAAKLDGLKCVGF